MPVSGPAYFPWGDPHGYPYGPHPMGEIGNVLIRGCTKLGIRVSTADRLPYSPVHMAIGRIAFIAAIAFKDARSAPRRAPLITHVPDALKNGAEIRDHSMVARIELGHEGRVTGVTYFDPQRRRTFQRAKAVIVCGYAIETPGCCSIQRVPDLRKDSRTRAEQLERYLMAQAGNVILGRFENLIRMYKAPPAHAMTEEFYETDPKRGFARGFAIQTVGPLPIAFAKQMMVAKGGGGGECGV